MHIPRPHSRVILCSVALALAGAGCGLKAPLYLPDDKAQEVKRSDAKRLPFPRRAPAQMPQPTPSTEPAQTPSTPPAGTTAPPTTDPDRPATPPPPAGT